MGDLTTTISAEAMEMNEMDRIFPSLLKKGFLTNIEYQKLICIKKLADRQLEIYKLLMVKDKSMADEMYTTFRRMTSRVNPKKSNGHHEILTAVVADCIFEFLPMSDVLNCRLVCQQWKTASSNTLRKRVTINFRKGLEPIKFSNLFLKAPADMRFQSFKFQCNYPDGWDVMEIQEFFDKWGASIKSLKFDPPHLFKKNKNNSFRSYDITHWIRKAQNLTKLDINCSSSFTKMNIQLCNISFVKFLSVRECNISIDDALKENIQFKPVEIDFEDVAFQSEGVILKKFRLNDVVDFSQVKKINLYINVRNTITKTKFEFDMISQSLNIKSLQLANLKLTNWAAASGKINFFYLRGSNFVERNRLQIDQLFCEDSTVDFSTLPKTIEKLHFNFGESMTYVGREEVDLPQLKYLRLDKDEDFPQISYFTRCWNLVELELGGSSYGNSTVNPNDIIRVIPKSVKRLKINYKISHDEEDANAVIPEIRRENCILNLDTLILEDYLECISPGVSQLMSIIKPKVLVVSCCDEETIIDTTSICDFLLANKQLKKIIIGSRYDELHKKTPFESSVFARFVGRKKSDYYEFVNHHETASEYEDPVGTPILEEEFDLYRQMNCLDRSCYTSHHCYF